MFRLTFLWMCLIAALAGTPLRQAEAADDFASALAELAGGHLVEVVDGGVGDDTGEVVLSQGTDGHSFALGLSDVPAIESWLAAPCADLHPGGARRVPVDPLVTRPAAFERRYAWLQSFLF